MRGRVIRGLAGAVAAAFLLAGCWDLRELDNLALVMAVGIDKADVPNRYRVTVQIARPGASGKGKAGGGQGGDEPVYTATADGDTLFAAIRNLAQFTSRRIMWAHNNVVVIGEPLAREDITPVIDFFTRNQELRMRTWITVARDAEARTVVGAKTGIEKVPANSLSALFRYARVPGEAVQTDVNEVVAAFFSPDLHPVISALGLRERAVLTGTPEEHGGVTQVELRGTAVFRDNRLVGYLDGDAGRGLLWLRGEMRNAVLTLPCPKGDDRTIAMEVRQPRVTVTTSHLEGGLPVITAMVRASGWLTEQDCQTPELSAVELKAYAERQFARRIEENIRAALAALQNDLRVDAVQYGQLVHLRHRRWWDANRHRWGELFPQVRTHTDIAVRVPKMGLYTRPMKAKSPEGGPERAEGSDQ